MIAAQIPTASCRAGQHLIYLTDWTHIMALPLTLAWPESIVALRELANANSGFHCVGHVVMLGHIYTSVRLARTYANILCRPYIC